MITGRASGALRQEYHDLELLDEITKLCYLGQLPSSINGDRRNALIHEFRMDKGMDYVPSTVHSSIKWSKNDPMLDPIADDLLWKVVTKESIPSSSSKIDISNSIAFAHPKAMRERKSYKGKNVHRAKICKTSSNARNNGDNANTVNVQSLIPIGTTWDQNGCAYDAILCIICTFNLVQ